MQTTLSLYPVRFISKNAKPALIALSLLFAATIFLSSNWLETNEKANITAQIERIPEKSKETVADFTSVAKKAIPAVVWIKVKGTEDSDEIERENRVQTPYGEFDWRDFFNIPKRESKSHAVAGQGSGVIVSKEGHILTNSHVVHNMDSIAVQLEDGREFTAKVLGDDPTSEVALIKIDGSDFPYLALGNSDLLEVGQWVAAIGNPFGLQATLTVGVVSAKGRSDLDITRYEDFIQTDTAINRGNSGGPLLNLNGEVVGITTAIASTSGSGYLGIGFAIPSNMAKHIMNEILSDGKISRGYLGVGLQTIDYPLAEAFGLKKPGGALVSTLVKGSPADSAGIKQEDIILSYNDTPVKSAAMLRNAVYRMKPGTKVELTLIRENQLIKVPVNISELSESRTQKTEEASKEEIGIEVSAIPSENSTNETGGVLIKNVLPGSTASLSGLKKGQVILSVNKRDITSPDMLKELISKVEKGKPVLFKIKEGELTLYVALKP